MRLATIAIAALGAGWTTAALAAGTGAPADYDGIIAKHSRATGVPESLIRRVIVRESKYNPRAMNRGHYGMMQIKPATAKAMGYRGSAAGLLDADVNLTYGVRYLAGAWKVASGNHDRAMRYYASGYYYDAKRRGMLAQIGMGRDGALSAPPAAPTVMASAAPVATPVSAQPQLSQPSLAPTPPIRGAAPSPTPAPQVAALATGQRTAAGFVPVPQARGPAAAAPAAAALASVVPTPRPRDLGPETTGSVATADARRPAAPLPPIRTAEGAPAAIGPAAKTRMIAPAAPVLASAGPTPAPARMTPTPPRR